MKNYIQKYCIAISLIVEITALSGCKKDWLDAKPNLSLVVPKTIADFQAILDNTSQNNGTTEIDFNSGQNALNELGAGDFYVTSDRWTAASYLERNVYIWGEDIFGTEANTTEYDKPYKRVFYSNVVLEGIEKVMPKSSIEQAAWNQVKGSAYFFRAYNHFDIAQQFCKPYNKSTSKSDLGIPLRVVSDFNIKSVRSTVEQTYSQIIYDLMEAISLLPFATPEPSSDTVLYRVRPNKAAVNAMLARVYLSMSNYDSALYYANQSLQLYDVLMDYNQFSKTSNVPIGRCNEEVLFHSTLNTYALMLNSRLIVDPSLYQSYGPNDLRKDIFFRTVSNNITFKGSYARGSVYFGGLACDELYLIRAECNARKGNTNLAIQDLNSLLSKRWNNSVPYSPINTSTSNEALEKVLLERRKELCYRGLRWTDIRRLNFDTQFAITLTKVINGQTFTLSPNDKRYVFPFPNDVILLTGMQQNPR